MYKKRTCILAILQTVVLALAINMFTSGETRVEGNDSMTGNGRPYDIISETVYKLEFEEGKNVKDYSGSKTGWEITNTANASIEGSLLKSNKNLSISGRYMPGDDYGAEASVIKFRTVYGGKGSLTLGMRKILVSDKYTDSGIWFTFTGTEIEINEKSGGLSAVIDLKDGAKDIIYILRDTHDEIKLYSADPVPESSPEQLILTLKYAEKELSVYDKDGNAVAEHVPHNNVPLNGFFSLHFDKFDGGVGNISYNRCEINPLHPDSEQRIVDYSTWTAHDDIGRVMPLNNETGNKKNDRYVGVFYFICNGYTGEPREVRDFTRMYLTKGLDFLKDHLKTSPGGYWAEPFFGYYINTDEWVYRKHAYMLSQAGVDFVFLDMSNALVYEDAHVKLFDTWLQIRREGGQTPQIVCMTGDMPSTLVIDLYTLMDTVYSKPEYKELFFMWEGKPLILGNNDSPEGDTWSVSTGTTPQTREAFYDAVNKNKKIGEYYNSGKFAEDLSGFTVRKSWAWQSGQHNGYWDWLSDSPQPYGTDFNGNKEQMSVTMGYHAHTNRGRSGINGSSDYDRNGDFGYSYEKTRYGLLFDEQFKNAIEKDPSVIMITGWNEWYAGVYDSPDPNQITGGTLTPGRYLIDQFTPEYSRDGEPMKIRDGVGFGDNFYYQMVRYIRMYKGMDPVPVADPGRANELTMTDAVKDAEIWSEINPEYMDTVGDTAYRNQISFQTEYRYQNSSGRNDIDTAKVAQDDKYMYFRVSTARDIIRADDAEWMNLYIDADSDAATGWEGYDIVINRSRDADSASVERFVNNSWEFEEIGRADYMIDGNTLTFRLDKSLLYGISGGSGTIKQLAFKWADNSVSDGDVMRFMDLGDTAPNDRFNFIYTTETLKGKAGGNTKHIPFTTVLCICLAAAAVIVFGILGGIVFLPKFKKKKDSNPDNKTDGRTGDKTGDKI